MNNWFWWFSNINSFLPFYWSWAECVYRGKSLENKFEKFPRINLLPEKTSLRISILESEWSFSLLNSLHIKLRFCSTFLNPAVSITLNILDLIFQLTFFDLKHLKWTATIERMDWKSHSYFKIPTTQTFIDFLLVLMLGTFFMRFFYYFTFSV